MKFRQLGASGVSVSELGFGTGDNAGLMVNGTFAEQRTVVERALELGVNYFDTAGDYGKGAGETNLGTVLKELRAPAVIAVKVEVWPRDLPDIASAVVRRAQDSLRRLRVDHVDVVMIHNEPVASPRPASTGWSPLSVAQFVSSGGALEGLRRLQASGITRLVGFTCARGEPEAIRQVLASGGVNVINVWLNLLNPTAAFAAPPGLAVPRDFGQIVDDAAKVGVGVAVFRPLAGGALTGQAFGTEKRHRLAGGLNTHEPGPYLDDVRRAGAFAQLAGNDPQKLVALAYRFCISHPAVSTVLGGFSEVRHLEDALEALETGPLTPTELTALENVWKQEPTPRIS